MTGVALTRSTHIPCEEAHTHHARECAPPLCHSERSEESRLEKGRRFFAYALNDKRLDADMNIPPAPLQGGKAKRSVGKTGTPLGGGLKA